MPGDNSRLPEPWLRGTLASVPAVPRAVLHALELAREDTEHHCSDLTDTELHARPFGIPSVAFHLKHIARSVDRLLTYAEGRPLSEAQMMALKSEWDDTTRKQEIFAELKEALAATEARLRALNPTALEEPRTVGRKQFTTTVAGLVVHVADHTQRHVGQAVTTAKIVRSQRSRE